MATASRIVISALALALSTSVYAEETAPEQAAAPVQEEASTPASAAPKGDMQDIDALRAQAPNNGDVSIKVQTKTFNDGALPNHATTTTDTTVSKPPHVVAQGAPLMATPDETDYPPTTDPESQLVYVSGGIGTSEIEYFKALKADYTFKLLMADKEGHLLGEATVTIADSKDKKIATLSDVGPYLVVKLPAGKYKITASLNGVDVLRNVTIKAGKQTAVDARF